MYLAHQFVSAACRMIGKRNGKPFPLQTLFVTVKVPDLPSSILIGYERVPLRLYIPNPHNRSLKVLVQGLDFMAHPLYIHTYQTLCNASGARGLDTPKKVCF
jgi:hypothetical protein